MTIAQSRTIRLSSTRGPSMLDAKPTVHQERTSAWRKNERRVSRTRGQGNSAPALASIQAQKRVYIPRRSDATRRWRNARAMLKHPGQSLLAAPPGCETSGFSSTEDSTSDFRFSVTCGRPVAKYPQEAPRFCDLFDETSSRLDKT
jgi:hypothetical protein